MLQNARSLIHIRITVFVIFFSLAVFPVAARAATDCAIDAGPCIKTVEGVTITFDVRPKPVVAMTDLTFSVGLVKDGLPLTEAEVSLDLTMPGMMMGKNRTILVHRGAGIFEGRGVIVRCPRGSKVWQASIAAKERGGITQTVLTFEVN